MAFTGIPTTALDFYEDLEGDNSKSFWTAHRHVYESCVRAPLEELTEALRPEFGEGKMFRPYRDVRFSADKTPYKTHQGVWFTEASTYVQVGAAGLFVAAGYWRTSPEQVTRLRRAAADDSTGPALQKAVETVTRKGFEVGGHRLVRVPAGFAKDHPRADLLRHKTLTVHRELGAPDWMATAKAKGEIAKLWRSMTPVVAWLDAYVGPA